MLWNRYPKTCGGGKSHFWESIDTDPKKVAIAADLEKWIILADAASAVHSAIHYKGNEEKWFHHPFASGWGNLNGYRNHDFRIFKTFFLEHKVLIDDKFIAKAWHEYDRVFRLYWVTGSGLSTLDDEKKKSYEGDIQNLHKFLLGVANTLREQIERNLVEIPEENP